MHCGLSNLFGFFRKEDWSAGYFEVEFNDSKEKQSSLSPVKQKKGWGPLSDKSLIRQETILAGYGTSAVNLEMSVLQVTMALGQPSFREKAGPIKITNTTLEMLIYKNYDIKVFYKNEKMTSIQFVNGLERVGEISDASGIDMGEMKTHTGSTDKGVSLLGTYDDVIKLYGQRRARS